MEGQSYIDKLESEWIMPFASKHRVANKWEKDFKRCDKLKGITMLNFQDKTEWIKDWGNASCYGEDILFEHNEESWKEALDYWYPELTLETKDTFVTEWIKHEIEKQNKGKKSKMTSKFTGRFVTLTRDAKGQVFEKGPLLKDSKRWIKAINHYINYKNIAPDYYKIAIESTLEGELHAHCIFLYDNLDKYGNVSKRHEGLGQKLYSKHWDFGLVNVKKMNFNNNPNAKEDALHYISKDDDAVYLKSDNWDMLVI